MRNRDFFVAHNIVPKSLSPAAQAACIDQGLHLIDDQVAGLVGTTERRQRCGRIWRYERFRAGDRRKPRCLDEDAPDPGAGIARAEMLRARIAQGAEGRPRLARLLRAEALTPLYRTGGPVLWPAGAATMTG